MCVVAPEELVAMKVIALHARRGRPKELSDRLDVKRLLLALPELKQADGAVSDRLQFLHASSGAPAAWREILRHPHVPHDDDGCSTLLTPHTITPLMATALCGAGFRRARLLRFPPRGCRF